MTAAHLDPAAAPDRRRAGTWFVVEGVLLILLGIGAAALPVMAGLAAGIVFGWVLIASGIVGVISLFSTRGQAHPVWTAVSALVALAAGVLVLWLPVAGVVSLALLIGAYLLLDALALIAFALDQRRRGAHGWGWLILSAVVSLMLCVFIVVLRPAGEALLVGFIVAIDLIMGGIALAALGVNARRAAAHDHFIR